MKISGGLFFNPLPHSEIRTRFFLLCFFRYHLAAKLEENIRKQKIFECSGGSITLKIEFHFPSKV